MEGMDICSVDGCDREVYRKPRQECMTHYHRFRRHGDYDTVLRTPSSYTWEERLTPDKWNEVPGPLDTPCWIWKMKPNSDGYAVMKYRQKAYKVYRVMWERSTGQTIPAGMSALHRCDTPACVNPTHIRIGTQEENIADMMSKGRQRSSRGLTDTQVRTIKALVRGGMRQSEVCRLLGVDSSTVSRIITGKLYRDVP